MTISGAHPLYLDNVHKNTSLCTGTAISSPKSLFKRIVLDLRPTKVTNDSRQLLLITLEPVPESDVNPSSWYVSVFPLGDASKVIQGEGSIFSDGIIALNHKTFYALGACGI